MDKNVVWYVQDWYLIVQDWYLIEKIVVVPVCLNGRFDLQNVWVLYRINGAEGDEPLPPLAF